MGSKQLSLRYLFLSRNLLHCGTVCRSMKIHPPVCLNVASLSTVSHGNRANFPFYQSLVGNFGIVKPVLHNRKPCTCQHFFSFCSRNFDSDLEDFEEVKEETVLEEFEDMFLDYNDIQVKDGFPTNEYFDTSNQGDMDNFDRELDAEWENELEELKGLLQCSQEKLVSMIANFPRLKDKELLKQVGCNVRILLDNKVSVKWIVSKLLSSQGLLLQIHAKELNTIFQTFASRKTRGKKHSFVSHKALYTELQSHLINRLKGGEEKENVLFLSELLNVKYDSIVKVHTNQDLEVINNRFVAFVLKEKVDYLLYEGFLPEDIAYNLDLLTMSLKFLGGCISEMKETVGDVSIPMLRSSYYKKVGLRDLPSVSNIHAVLDCSLNDFSDLQREFLNHTNQAEDVSVALYLLANGISKQEIICNPYVLGHKLDKVKGCFKIHSKSCDISTVEGQRKLLNLVVYDLEYRKSTT